MYLHIQSFKNTFTNFGGHSSLQIQKIHVNLHPQIRVHDQLHGMHAHKTSIPWISIYGVTIRERPGESGSHETGHVFVDIHLYGFF